jgi:hypothetical protein
MVSTQWSVAGPESTVYELEGRRFGSGDEGATMQCNFVCDRQGRHAHITYCTKDCVGNEAEHITARIEPDANQPKDWITHRLKWARNSKKFQSIQTWHGNSLSVHTLGFKGLIQHHRCWWLQLTTTSYAFCRPIFSPAASRFRKMVSRQALQWTIPEPH